MTPHRKHETPRSLRKAYTVGEVNKLIDAIFHPLAKQNLCIVILDGMFHAINEGNPQESALKFIKYNGSKLVNEFLKIKESHGEATGKIRKRR